MPGPRRIALLGFDGVQSLDLTGPLEVFATASWFCTQRGDAAAYTTEIVAPTARPITSNSGLRMVPDRAIGAVRGRLDTLIVAGGSVERMVADRVVRRWLVGQARRVRRLASVCSGAFILAEAGLLAGRRATTHWAGVERFVERYPDVDVEADAIFVRDGDVYTSAGVTSGIDLALALVEDDLGHAIALQVARWLVVFLKRPGGQSQFSSHLAAQAIPPGRLKDLPEWIVGHLREDLSVDALAARLAMSPRHFARVFRQESGVTPAKFVERARLDAARRQLENGGLGFEDVAGRCGFGSAEQMRRTFTRHLRIVPIDYRRHFQRRAMPPPRRDRPRDQTQKPEAVRPAVAAATRSGSPLRNRRIA
ncbi:MAG: GlxA family transcriptional regulator [bacterium]